MFLGKDIGVAVAEYVGVRVASTTRSGTVAQMESTSMDLQFWSSARPCIQRGRNGLSVTKDTTSGYGRRTLHWMFLGRAAESRASGEGCLE